MNFFQRLILLVGTAALFLCCLVPPWKEMACYPGVIVAERPSYYAPLWKPPGSNGGTTIAIDVTRLATQVTGIVGTTTGLVLMFGSRRRA